MDQLSYIQPKVTFIIAIDKLLNRKQKRSFGLEKSEEQIIGNVSSSSMNKDKAENGLRPDNSVSQRLYFQKRQKSAIN